MALQTSKSVNSLVRRYGIIVTNALEPGERSVRILDRNPLTLGIAESHHGIPTVVAVDVVLALKELLFKLPVVFAEPIVV